MWKMLVIPFITMWKMLVIPFIAFALILTPVIPLVSETSYDKIIIDSEFSDWTGLTTPVSQMVQLNSNIDMINLGAENNGKYLSFFIETRGSILSGGNGIVDTFMMFIDYDLDDETGYRMGYLGADYKVMIYGLNGNIEGSAVDRFDGSSDRNDWNGWTSFSRPEAASQGNRLEAQIPWDILGDEQKQVDVLFYSQDHLLDEDFSERIMSNLKGILEVETRSKASEIIVGNDNPLLTISLNAIQGDMNVEEIEVTLTGTANPSEVVGLRLFDQTMNNNLDSATPSGKNVSFSLDDPIRVTSGSTTELIVLADVSGSSGRTLGASIVSTRDIKVDSGTVSMNEISSAIGLGYVGRIPQNLTIDGAFSDWTGLNSDLDGTQLPNPDTDIRDYCIMSEGNSVLFYSGVEGNLMRGNAVPFRNRIKAVVAPSSPYDSDRDTVPDEFDQLPFNFDNQALDDIETNNDVDEDGLRDYPHGSDYWLNTTIPLSFPAPYGGRDVSIFIGTVTKPPLVGDDVLRVYIDAVPSLNEGYSAGSLYADYMVQIAGKNGEVFKNELFRFPSNASPGDGSAWTYVDDVAYATDFWRIEGIANLGIALNASIAEVFIEMVNDASGSSDETAKVQPEATKGTSLQDHMRPQKVFPNFEEDSTYRKREGSKAISTLIDSYSDDITTYFNNQRKVVRAGDVAGDNACDATNSDGCWYVLFDNVITEGPDTWYSTIIMRSSNTEGSSWGSQIILSSGREADNPILLVNQSDDSSIAIDSSGYIHVAWASNNTEGGGIYFVRYTKTTVAYPTQSELASSSNWEPVTKIDDTYAGAWPSISTDSSNAPHITWSYYTTSHYYKNKVGGSWRSTIIWSGDYAGSSADVSPQNDYVSIVRFYEGATNDVQYLVCKDLSTSSCDAASEFTKWDGTAGSDTVASDVGSSAFDHWPTIATTYESNGDLWVGYAKDISGTTRGIYGRYLDYPSSGWQTEEEIDSITDTIFWNPTIGVDPAGDVYALYEDYDSIISYIKIRTGGSWGSRTQVGTAATSPVMIVRMPNSAGYGFDPAAVYYEYDDYETYHYYIPEFSELILPISFVTIIPIAMRVRRRRNRTSRLDS
jgi:hypothetical protein